MTNDPTGYDFSQAAYNFLFRKKVSPSSPDKFLSSLSPQESQKQNEAEKGWIQYNKLSDAIDNELQKRGLSSTQQTGAEDLAFLKAKFIEKLSRRTDAEGALREPGPDLQGQEEPRPAGAVGARPLSRTLPR